jgi:hypothetical protein
LQWGAVMLCGKPWHRSRSSTNSLAPTSMLWNGISFPRRKGCLHQICSHDGGSLFLEIVPCYVVQAGLQLTTFLPQQG